MPVVLLCLIALAPATAHAQTVPLRPRVVERGVDPNHFAGVVVDIVGSPDNPAGVTLQLGTLTFNAAVSMRTNIVARSAEAQIEGLSVHDFAVVTGRRIKGLWTATRIAFDVYPVPPLRIVTGLVRRVSVDGQRIWVKPDRGALQLVRIIPETRVAVGGHLQENPPQFAAGMVVQVLGIKDVNGNVLGYDINVSG